MNIRFSIFTILVVALASCSGVKNLKSPELPQIPEQFTGAASADSLSAADISWWEFYNDPALCKIIQRALTYNRDLLAAGDRIREYDRLYGVTRVNMLPEISGTAGVSNETNDYYGGKDSHDMTAEVKVTAAWEINLWGAKTWEQKAAKAEWLSAIESERAMRMSLIAKVASAYFNYIALRDELAIVKRTLETRVVSAEKAKLRFEGGVTSEIIYRQALVELSTTASLIPALESRLNEVRNGLTLLMGTFPGDLIFNPSPDIEVTLPDDVPAGLPSAVLQRRPDIRIAEQNLAAAMANVGLKYADRFPRLRIALTGGVENDELKNTLRSPFSYIIGNISGTILDFGRRKRRYQAAIAAYDRARHSYEQTVLNAFAEVDNAITNYANTRRTAELKSELRDAAGKYVTLAQAQYLGGSLAYIDFLDANRRYFDAQIAYSNAIRDERLALVNLYKVLGGGWQQ